MSTTYKKKKGARQMHSSNSPNLAATPESGAKRQVILPFKGIKHRLFNFPVANHSFIYTQLCSIINLSEDALPVHADSLSYSCLVCQSFELQIILRAVYS
mmetsp:Transcript_68/g.114  ORF Transcript_68/g.114 Transcript_68/m.114 type:complete len:100 (+) Transcript_68:411-710(+)